MFTYKAIVRNLINGSEFSATFQSVFSNPDVACAEYERTNNNRLQVIELRATLKAPQRPLEATPDATPSATPAATPSATPAAPESAVEPEPKILTLLDDSVSLNVNGSPLTLNLFAEYHTGRCEVTFTASLNSRVSLTRTVVANSLQAAFTITRIMSMQGHRWSYVKELQALERLQQTCDAERG